MNRFFNWLARYIATHPKVRDRIIDYAMKRPFWHIVGHDDQLYMKRWWLMPKWMLQRVTKQDPAVPEHTWSYYDVRWNWLPKIRLHLILRPDEDRAKHDHPADYRTLIIDGWYLNQDVYDNLTAYYAGTTYAARAETFHRIDQVSPGGVTTIFIMGPWRQTWGFLLEDQKLPYYSYLNPNEHDAHAKEQHHA